MARIIGYEDIATTLMSDVLPPAHSNDTQRVEEQIRDILTGCGLMETINYALTTPENHDKLTRAVPGTAEQNERFITLLNPLNVDRRVMRRSMLVSTSTRLTTIVTRNVWPILRLDASTCLRRVMVNFRWRSAV